MAFGDLGFEFFPMDLIDTHTHLDSFARQGVLTAVLARARAAGVGRMIAIGAHVTTRSGLSGYVVAERSTPGGGAEFEVQTPGALPTSAWLPAARLTVLPDPPPIEVGAVVRCYAQTCEVLSRDDATSTYALLATLTLPSGAIVADHHYPAVPRHHIALWEDQ